MARSLATSDYRAADVEARVRSGGAQFSCRFELRDVFAPNSDPTPLRNVTAARVSFNADDEEVGKLELRLLADERLRNAPYRYSVIPWFGIGPMLDGGTAEHQMGVWPWPRPKRDVLGTDPLKSEEWTITLPDQSRMLRRSGPGLTAYSAKKGTQVQQHIAAVLTKAGFPDTTGVEDTDALIPEDATWHFDRTTKVKKSATKATKKAAATDAEVDESEAESWLGIESDLHASGGYEQPWFDLRGLYRARASTPWNAPAHADVIYESGSAGTLLLPASSEPETERLANRVLGTNDSTNEEPNFEAVADLNVLLPTHPFCEHNVKRFFDQTYKNPLASSQQSLQREVEAVLRDAISNYDLIRISTAGFLAVHELNEIVGVRIDGDPELSGPDLHLCREVGWALDLFTGEMDHDLRRMFQTL